MATPEPHAPTAQGRPGAYRCRWCQRSKVIRIVVDRRTNSTTFIHYCPSCDGLPARNDTTTKGQP